MPAEIQTDQGTHFVADTLNQLYKTLGIVHKTSAAYRPQSQGITDRYNSTLINMLRCYTDEDQKDRNRYVKLVMFAYNSATHASTCYSPFYLLHGFESNQPEDLALLPTVSDQVVLAALKVIHKVIKEEERCLLLR